MVYANGLALESGAESVGIAIASAVSEFPASATLSVVEEFRETSATRARVDEEVANI